MKSSIFCGQRFLVEVSYKAPSDRPQTHINTYCRPCMNSRRPATLDLDERKSHTNGDP